VFELALDVRFSTLPGSNVAIHGSLLCIAKINSSQPYFSNRPTVPPRRNS
jgi:hypothetical protein